MLIDVDNRSGVPIYRQIIDQIRRHILAGELQAEAQLPSVRELAAQLSINPMTVSKAYSLLEIEGFTENRRGVGLFVKRLPDSRKSKDRKAILERMLREAAVTAVQLGVSAADTINMLNTIFRNIGDTPETKT